MFAAAKISSDFEVKYVKPYAIQVQWIMSEKYKGLPIIFEVNYIGRPGYETVDDGIVYLDGYPQSEGMCVNLQA